MVFKNSHPLGLKTGYNELNSWTIEVIPMIYGVDYYPEHWPKERWPIDARLMREAGINTVRLAEFSWALLEPRENCFDFSWLDEAITCLARENIRVILGTPTAAPPKWLVDKYPDILQRDIYGRPRGFGTRRHYCFNSLEYQRLTERIVTEMAGHYRDNPTIIAWQIDNEFGCHNSTRCYCDNCLKAFQEWLKQKYGTVEILNSAWGTVFWSQIYNNWEDVILPMYAESQGDSYSNLDHNPGLLLDFARFSSDSAVSYQRLQIDSLRTCSQLPVTHNMMGGFDEIDYFKLAQDLDVVSWDNYPTMEWGTSSWLQTSMNHDFMRGLKDKPFWVMEQQSGPCGWHIMGNTPRPGQLRLWAWQAVAHGAEAIVYFRWRACLFGTEVYWYGILDHDGIKKRRYDEIQATGREMRQLERLITEGRIKTAAAIIKSYDNSWSHGIQNHTRKFNYNQLILSYYSALSSRHIPCDMAGMASDLSRYRLIIMPAYNLMNDAAEEKLTQYVAAGGTLVVTFRSGTREDSNAMTERTLPGYFKKLAGVEVYEFDCIFDERSTLISSPVGAGKASMWCDILKCETSEPFGVYGSDYYAGEAAITVNTYGKGRVWYIGCNCDQDFLDRLMGHILSEAGISSPIPNLPQGVECLERVLDGKSHYILLNHNSGDAHVRLEASCQNLLTGLPADRELALKAYDVAVLRC